MARVRYLEPEPGSELETESGAGHRRMDLEQVRKWELMVVWEKEDRSKEHDWRQGAGVRQVGRLPMSNHAATYLFRQLPNPFTHLSNAPQPVSGVDSYLNQGLCGWGPLWARAFLGPSSNGMGELLCGICSLGTWVQGHDHSHIINSNIMFIAENTTFQKSISQKI